MRRGRADSEGGFALLVVLFTIGLLSVLIASLMAHGRGMLTIARELRDAAAAEAAADGAMHQAIYQVRHRGWEAGGSTHMLSIGRATVAVTVLDERGRINPNRTGVALLSALLIDGGIHPAQAADLAAALVDWRTATPFSIAGGLKLDRYRLANLPYGPPDRPFTSVDELVQVPGMTAPLLAHVRDHLSVYQPGMPVAVAGEQVSPVQAAAIISQPPPAADVGAGGQVVELRAVAALPGGVTARRAALVHLGASIGVSRDWQILTWGEDRR